MEVILNSEFENLVFFIITKNLLKNIQM